MRWTLWIWTATCGVVVVVAFFAAPAWDTDGFLISGTQLFILAAFLIFGIWLVGLGILAAIVALVRVIRRDGGGRAWWSRRGKFGKASIIGLAAVIVVTLALGAARLSNLRTQGGSESDGTSDFVSFGTVDADPDWSPDGRSIAFATTRGSGGVYVVRPDGTAMRRVFRGDATDVDWSPDGKSIAFANERGIYVMRIRDGRPKLVREGDFYLPAWAPNGRALAVVKDEPGLFSRYGGPPFKFDAPAIYVVRVDGSGLRRLLPRYRRAVGAARPGSVAAVSETEPAWSPDGSRIAFQAGDGEIVAADVESGHRVTTSRGGYEPAWSPDGRLIAYQCAGDVCVANADGSGNEHRVASGGGDPSWSPDSRLLVFEHYLYGGSGYGSHPRSLSIVDADGKDLRKLTFGPTS